MINHYIIETGNLATATTGEYVGTIHGAYRAAAAASRLTKDVTMLTRLFIVDDEGKQAQYPIAVYHQGKRLK